MHAFTGCHEKKNRQLFFFISLQCECDSYLTVRRRRVFDFFVRSERPQPTTFATLSMWNKMRVTKMHKWNRWISVLSSANGIELNTFLLVSNHTHTQNLHIPTVYRHTTANSCNITQGTFRTTLETQFFSYFSWRIWFNSIEIYFACCFFPLCSLFSSISYRSYVLPFSVPSHNKLPLDWLWQKMMWSDDEWLKNREKNKKKKLLRFTNNRSVYTHMSDERPCLYHIGHILFVSFLLRSLSVDQTSVLLCASAYVSARAKPCWWKARLPCLRCQKCNRSDFDFGEKEIFLFWLEMCWPNESLILMSVDNSAVLRWIQNGWISPSVCMCALFTVHYIRKWRTVLTTCVATDNWSVKPTELERRHILK